VVFLLCAFAVDMNSNLTSRPLIDCHHVLLYEVANWLMIVCVNRKSFSESGLVSNAVGNCCGQAYNLSSV